MRTRLSKPSSCRGCPLEFIGTGFSEPEGSGASGLMVIGESLNHHAAVDGLPFRPQADDGSLLNRAFGMAGQRRDPHVLFNVIACQPPKGELVGMSWEFPAIQHCQVHWRRVVEQFKPKAILAMGAVALRTLTGLSGDRLSLEYLRGYCLDSVGPLLPNTQAKTPIIGTYHPSHVKRGKWPLLPVIVKDIRFALDVAQHGPPDISNLEYVVNGTEGHLEAMRDEMRASHDIPLSTDIETNYSELVERSVFEAPEMLNYTGQMRQQVTQVNLSIREGSALVVDATPSKLALVREIHALPNMKVGHNILMFDQPVCEDNGIPIMGPIEDTMWRFHHLYPDLPGSSGRMSGTGDDYSEAGSVANLQYVANFAGFPIAWKHLSNADPGWYGGCDADAGLRSFWWTNDELVKLGIMDGYQSMVAQLMPILADMCRRGIPVNAAMLHKLHGELMQSIKGIDRDIQTYIPEEILPLHPKTGWKKPPKGAVVGEAFDLKKKVKGQVIVIPSRVIEIDVDLPAETKSCCFRACRPPKVGKKSGVVNAKTQAKYERRIMSSHARVQKGVIFAPDPDCPNCGGNGVIRLPDRVERRWAGELPFNAASSDQMFAYANWKGYVVPKNSKRKVAMDAEVVGKLAKKYQDPVFTLCDNKRGFVKLDSTYCQGWMPGPDGRVHSQIGPYPATGQLSGRKPNPQNVPALAKIDPVKNAEKLRFSTEFREALWAEPDHVIVECDYKSFHVQTLGYEAGDPVYIGLGKTDIHSFFAVCGLLKVETRDALLKPAWENLSRGRADKELGQKLKWYRKNFKLKNGADFDMLRNKQAKVAILAYGLGQQYGSLYRANEDAFSCEDEARQLIKSMDRIFEKESSYRETIPLTVRPNGYKLINRFGLIRWFFGVQKINRQKGIWEHGDEWEAAIAFNVQASAHGHLRTAMKAIDAARYAERFGLDNTVHDSLRFHCLKSRLEELIHCVKPIMETPSEIMLMNWDENRGLSVEVEVKAGDNWGPGMREVA